MKMDLRMKATLLVGVISFMQRDSKCCRFLEQLGMGSVFHMRDENGALTQEGKMVMSLFFALLTYMVMSMRK
jgi:hypothetical protein